MRVKQTTPGEAVPSTCIEASHCLTGTYLGHCLKCIYIIVSSIDQPITAINEYIKI